MSLDALVSLHDFLCVHGQPFVWFHHETEEARVRVETKNADIHNINRKSTISVCVYSFVCY
jgi:hypothetical protein